MCCSVLQCVSVNELAVSEDKELAVAVCRSVLQCVAVNELAVAEDKELAVAVCCSGLQWVAVCLSQRARCCGEQGSWGL